MAQEERGKLPTYITSNLVVHIENREDITTAVGEKSGRTGMKLGLNERGPYV